MSSEEGVRSAELSDAPMVARETSKESNKVTPEVGEGSVVLLPFPLHRGFFNFLRRTWFRSPGLTMSRSS